MHKTKTLTLAGCAFAALVLGGSMPAYAASSMCSDGTMMAENAMMEDEHMGGDTMMEGEGMMDEGEMSSEDSMMAEDSTMSQDSMMAEDSMMSEDDTMIEEDSMMAEGSAMMTGEYTVQTGDSLYSIAEAQLCDGDRYPELIAANEDVLDGVTTLQPGMVLQIPGD